MEYKFAFLDSSGDEAADNLEMLDLPSQQRKNESAAKKVPEAWKPSEIHLYDVSVQPNLSNDIGVMGAITCADKERWLLLRVAGGDFEDATRLGTVFSEKIKSPHNALAIKLEENEILQTLMTLSEDGTGVFLDIPLPLLETNLASATPCQRTGCASWFRVGAANQYEQPVLAKGWRTTGTMFYAARQITFYSQTHKMDDEGNLSGVYTQISIKDTDHQFEHFARISRGKVYCHTDYAVTQSKGRDYLSFAPGFLFISDRLESLYEPAAWLHPQGVTRFMQSRDMTFPVFVHSFAAAETHLNAMEDPNAKTHGVAFALCGEILTFEFRKQPYISVLRCGTDLPCGSTCDKLLYYNKQTKQYECSGVYSLNHGSNPPKLVTSAGVDVFLKDGDGNIVSVYKPHGFAEQNGIHKKQYSSINKLYNVLVSSGNAVQSAKKAAVNAKIAKATASKLSVIFFMLKKEPKSNKTNISLFWTAALRKVETPLAGMTVLRNHFPWHFYLTPTSFSYSRFFMETQLDSAKLKRKFHAAQIQAQKRAQENTRANKKRITSRN